MKSRLATSIRSSFLYMNLRGRILVSTLLAVIVTAAAGAQSTPAVSSAEARKAIQATTPAQTNNPVSTAWRRGAAGPQIHVFLVMLLLTEQYAAKNQCLQEK